MQPSRSHSKRYAAPASATQPPWLALPLALLLAVPLSHASRALAQPLQSAPAQPAPQTAPPAPTPPDQNPLAPETAADDPLHTASRQELDVVKVLLGQEKAWNAGDLQGYIEGYKNSPDTIFISHDAIKGYAQILDDYQHNYVSRAQMGTLTYSELEVYPLSDTHAICLGKYHLERPKKDGGSADGFFSLVLEKTPSGWKIILDHTT